MRYRDLERDDRSREVAVIGRNGNGKVLWWGMGIIASLAIAGLTGVGGRIFDAAFLPRGEGVHSTQVAALESRLADAEDRRHAEIDAWRHSIDQQHREMERKLDLIIWTLGIDPSSGRRLTPAERAERR